MSGQNDYVIPKHLHAIWIGPIQNMGEEGLNNLVEWKQRNPDYSVNLWIDSATFSTEEDRVTYENLQKWAIENNITLHDIGVGQNTNGIVAEKDLYKKMKCKGFYDDEVLGVHKNLAAASDLLRLEILKRDGGVYFDVNDIIAPDEPLGDIHAPFGFLYHQNDLGENNDVLASIPNGGAVQTFIDMQFEKYKKLYGDETKVKSHRSHLYSRYDMYSGENSRKNSTQQLSGPGLLFGLWSKLVEQGKLFKEANGRSIPDESVFHYPNSKLAMTQEQSHSWYNAKEANIDEVKCILRNNIRVYYTKNIEKLINSLNHAIAQKQSSSYFFRSNQKIDDYQKLITILNESKIALNAPDIQKPMTETYQDLISKLEKKEYRLLSDYNINLFNEFPTVVDNAEAFLNYAETLDISDAREAISKFRVKGMECVHFGTFSIDSFIDSLKGAGNYKEIAQRYKFGTHQPEQILNEADDKSKNMEEKTKQYREITKHCRDEVLGVSQVQEDMSENKFIV
jgi:hypothetical protein